MTSPCATCTHGCCFQYAVTVTGYDAWLIANALRLAPETFLVTIPQRTPNVRGFVLDDSEQTYDIALDKAPADTEAKPCVFWLGFPRGIGRCGIYSLRPFACQVYPGILNDGAVERRQDVLCPDEAWRDGDLLQPIWRQRLLEMQVEFDIYGLAVARWNYHVQHTSRPDLIDVLGFYTFLMNFYDRLGPVRAHLFAAEWKVMCEHWGGCCAKGISPLMTAVPEMTAWSEVIDAIRAVVNSFFPADLVPQAASHGLRPAEEQTAEGQKLAVSCG